MSCAKAAERPPLRLGGIDGIVNAAGIMPYWRHARDAGRCMAPHAGSEPDRHLPRDPKLPAVDAEGADGDRRQCRFGRRPAAQRAGLTAYAASKGGVVNFGRALAAELAPQIRVNTVCPGLVDTPMGDKHRANVGNYALGGWPIRSKSPARSCI